MAARLCSISAGASPRNPSFAPRLEDHHSGSVPVQGGWQALQSTAGGITADAGVYDPVWVAGLLESQLEESRPSLGGFHAVGSAQAVTQHQNERLTRVSTRAAQ